MRNRSTRTRTATALVCATGIALFATACNEDLAQDGGSSDSPSKKPKPSASASKAVDSDTGKTLALGEATALTYRRASKHATYEVTAKSVKKGAQADLPKEQLTGEAQALQPYYVTMTFKNIGDGSVHYPFLDTPVAVRDARGEQAKTLITADDEVKQCPHTEPNDFAVGASATTCKILMLPKGSTPSVVLYTGDFDKGPVYWKAS